MEEKCFQAVCDRTLCQKSEVKLCIRVGEGNRIAVDPDIVVIGYVTGDDILFCFVSSVLRREDNQFSTGKSFSIIIVGITAQAQCQSFRDKCPEALSAGTGTVDGNSVFRQSVFVLTGDLCTEDRTEGTVGVADFQIQRSFRSLLYGFLQFL